MKKSNYQMWVIIIWISVAVAILFYGGTQGWFNNLTQNTFYSNVPNPNEVITQYLQYSAELTINPRTICVDDWVTGSLNTNIPNGVCSVFTHTPTTQWTFLKSAMLDNSGKYSENQQVHSAGTAYFIAVCCDRQSNCRITNTETLTVNVCDGDDSNPEPSGYDCVDSDGGKVTTTSGNCQDSFHQMGYMDNCLSLTGLREYYCDSQNICQYEDVTCQTGWVCISGACRQPECGGIPLPSSQNSCSAGHCSSGTCTFFPATLSTIARCGCI